MKKILTVKKQGDKKVLFEQNVLNESIITVGNNPSATLELKDTAIAPEQFVIISENEQTLLMNRADGTIINGENLDLGSKIELNEGDEIKIGEFNLVLSSEIMNGVNVAVENDSVSDEISDDNTQSEQTEEQKDFSNVLNNLKEEDSFYFLITDKEGIVERILFDSEEIWLGTSFAENAIKKEKRELDEVYARVKKDWSGAVIYPEESEEMYLNGNPLKEPSRLKNEDEIILLDEFAEDDEIQTSITFHEPVVLLALNSILPEELPEPVFLSSEVDSSKKDKEIENKQSEIASDQIAKKQVNLKQKTKRRIFGYFSILEIIIMAVGTLVTAAIIFLVLELV